MTSTGQISRRAVVHGAVQGVFFRDSTRREAERSGVTGWVRNRSDGTVEAVLQGTPEAVARVIDFLHEGPRSARVDHVDVSDAALENRRGFHVR